ncbi:unnamed protein product (macronuclear) [Paramecium tetraurelia]|uniref:Protein kinase domain-containing protein n=1 Tax=Paramecium tetraurelia TaxID=5888 RepID=A0BD98_PARTE|nr:uncharacterized protein GSPATT00004609001 [Paramecium tetraurelia]CAK56515.1 unnamed protein product [Paramecium tetraurelia]|eukprot:XP_001423913.1 hypothetical protein (macronuclear) [Paramecium tetraurelia strain d4-2]
MINISKLIKQRQQYSTILEDNSKLFIKPIDELGDVTFRGEFLIEKNGKLKKKQIQFQQHILVYSKNKHINILNATLLLHLTNLNEIEGLKFIKSGTSIDIYNNVIELYNYARKYCIQRDIPERYKITSTLYYGSNATFLQLESTLQHKAVYVAKIYEKQNYTTQDQVSGLKKEVQILRQLNHSQISNLVEIYENDELIFLIMEELKGETLQGLLENSQEFNESQIKQIMRPLFECVAYLHNNNIFHRDIKPQNIKFRQSDDYLQPCLIDFSLADNWNKNGRYLFTRCGSVGYVAPEVLQDKKYILNIDVYSLGVILYILATKKHPFEDAEHSKKILKNYNGKVDFTQVQCSQILLDLIRKCLEVDFTTRPSCKEILSHPFFSNRIPKLLSFKIKDQRKSTGIKSARIIHFNSANNLALEESMNSLSQSKSPSSFGSQRRSLKLQKQKTVFPEINISQSKSKYFQTRYTQYESLN